MGSFPILSTSQILTPFNQSQKKQLHNSSSPMASSSIAITASLPRGCRPVLHVTKKLQARAGTKPETHAVAPETQGLKSLNIADQQEAKLGRSSSSRISRDSSKGDGVDTDQTFAKKFSDERWKNGTWDLNMYVREGKIDWDGVIVAEARRRKFLEMYPETATNQEPVMFRSSIIPWWAWMMRSYLPDAELINGRAAMVGFFMAYFVDGLTGLDIVGQTGNLICKAGLLVTVMAVVFLRRTQDFDGLMKLAEDATLYDKQWQSSWQDQDGI